MRLLNTRTGDFIWVENPHQLRYAALSHVWCKDTRQETSYHDMVRFQDEVRYARERGEILPEDAVLSRASYKIRGACALARADGIDWLWADTCCIDKASSAELEGAINAMYTWYNTSTVCYVFLQDVDAHEDPYSPDSGFRQSEWHVRGWTLQELIAPQVVLFFSRSWRFIGAKHGMAGLIADVTGVDVEVITGSRPVDAVSVARRMYWASRRVTTKREDEAYALMGIFGVHIHVVYGEGSMTFLRLQEEILRRIPDESIFVWDRALHSCTASRTTPHCSSSLDTHSALFASSPAVFSVSADITSISKEHLSDVLGVQIPSSMYAATSHGMRAILPLLPLAEGVFAAVLACQRNDRLLGLVVKKTPTSDVYSIGVSHGSSDLAVDVDDLHGMVQLPVHLSDRLASPTSPGLKTCVKEITILHSSYLPPARQLSASNHVPLRSSVVGLSERSVRCLASVGYRSSLSATSVSQTTLALSSFEGTPIARVELRRCGCSSLLEAGPCYPCWFATRLTTASSRTVTVDYLDASRGMPERCVLGDEWYHLEAFTRSSKLEALPSHFPSSAASSDPDESATSVHTPHQLSAVIHSTRGFERRPQEFTFTLACDYPGDDHYPARFTLSIDVALRGEGTSTDTDESASTLTCEDAWTPPGPGRRGDFDADLQQQGLKEQPKSKNHDRDDDPGHHGDLKRAHSKKVAARLGSLLRMLSRSPARLWAAMIRGAVCQKEVSMSRTSSMDGSEAKGSCAACASRRALYDESPCSELRRREWSSTMFVPKAG